MPLPELFKKPPPPRRHYKKNYLTEVIARADFDSILPLQDGPPASFLRAAKARFPVSEPRTVMARELLISDDEVQDHKRDAIEWRYFDRDRTKHVNLGAGAVMVSATQYKRFEPFCEDFASLLAAALEPFPERQVARLGLRYINNIDLPINGSPTDWRDYFQPELCSVFNLADDTSTISRAWHVLEFNYGDANMRFQFGMHNPDYPSPIRQKVYLLDYDVYTNTLLERHEVAGYLDAFHRKVNASFEQVVTNKLRSLMVPTDD